MYHRLVYDKLSINTRFLGYNIIFVFILSS